MDTIKTRLKIGFPKKKEWKNYPAILTDNSLLIAGHQIMQKWETNYMKMLASIVTRNGGDILELGYGLGISSKFIHELGEKRINTHTIIEMHPDVVKLAKKDLNYALKIGKVKILEGFWEDIVPHLPKESFDGILFDTYPLNAKEFHSNHYKFFKHAYRLLRQGGIFTYYSDEYKTFSKNHLKHLNKAGFSNLDFKICKVNPPKNCMYWNKKTILAPIIVK